MLHVVHAATRSLLTCTKHTSNHTILQVVNTHSIMAAQFKWAKQFRAQLILAWCLQMLGRKEHLVASMLHIGWTVNCSL